MLPLLYLVPAFASLILGIVYLMTAESGRLWKIGGTGLFLLAVYLQFFSPFGLAGLLLQVGLAFSLALWRKLTAAT